MKVLIIKLSAFGDIIHALPALDDLLTKPEVDEIHWLVDQRFEFVTALFPESVHVHTIAMKGERPVRAIWESIKQLRRERFDIVFDLQGLIKSSLMAALTGAKVYGFDRQEIREKPAAWLEESVPFHADDRHIVQQCRRVATGPWQSGRRPQKAIAYRPPCVRQNLPDVPLPPELETLDIPWVILNLGGSWETKQLADSTWQEIANGIEQRGAHALICWGNDDERKKALRIAAKTNAIPFPERLDILPLCTLLRRSTAVITTDTGILHLASALGTPTVSFWGVTPSWRNGAFAEYDLQIESNPECGPCIKRTCANFICMDMIRAETILEKLDHHLSKEAAVSQGDKVG